MRYFVIVLKSEVRVAFVLPMSLRAMWCFTDFFARVVMNSVLVSILIYDEVGCVSNGFLFPWCLGWRIRSI